MGITYHEHVDQGSEAWLRLRLGKICSSEMKLIATLPPKEETRVKKNGEPYKQREWAPVADDADCRKHLYELAAQRITNFVEPMFQSYEMIRGQNDEAEARSLYAKHHAPVREVGCVTNDRWGFTLAWSPDGLVADDGGLEIKSRKQRYQVQTVIEYLTTGGIPAEYVLQVQTGLLVSERKWIDFVSYSEKLPMAVIRVHPDEKIQAGILEAAAAAEARITEIITAYRAATNPIQEQAA